jgi:hypothetical protein
MASLVEVEDPTQYNNQELKANTAARPKYSPSVKGHPPLPEQTVTR